MKNTPKIKPGDVVTLGPENGLRQNLFIVLRVNSGDSIHKLIVQDAKGQVWPARIEFARIVA